MKFRIVESNGQYWAEQRVFVFICHIWLKVDLLWNTYDSLEEARVALADRLKALEQEKIIKYHSFP